MRVARRRLGGRAAGARRRRPVGRVAAERAPGERAAPAAWPDAPSAPGAVRAAARVRVEEPGPRCGGARGGRRETPGTSWMPAPPQVGQARCAAASIWNSTCAASISSSRAAAGTSGSSAVRRARLVGVEVAQVADRGLAPVPGVVGEQQVGGVGGLAVKSSRVSATTEASGTSSPRLSAETSPSRPAASGEQDLPCVRVAAC